MMQYDIIRLTSVSVVGLIAIVVIKRIKEEYALFISLFISILLMIAAISYIEPVFGYIQSIKVLNESTSYYIKLMIKCSSCAMLCSFGSELCRDCGENSLGSKIELCGKCIIISLCLPLVKTVFDYVSKLVF